MKHNPAITREEAFPVLVLYYDEAQSSQHPKEGISSTGVVLRRSTIQPAPERRQFQYSCCTTMKHVPAVTREEAFPVLISVVPRGGISSAGLYYDDAQSSQHPRGGISSTGVVLR